MPIHSHIAKSDHARPFYPEPLSDFFHGTDSEYGDLTDVLVASPQHLSIVPCNLVSEHALKNGERSRTAEAKAQHRALVEKLTSAGVRVLTVNPVVGLPDLAFARDSSVMTPWGLIGLRPGAAHRRGEVDVVLQAAREAVLPILGRVSAGFVEGGDVCLLRPGHVAIGVSGQRTDEVGAQALGGFFERRGWRVIYTPIQPDLLHLDTHFCMLDQNLALACIERIDCAFLREVIRLDIEVVPVREDEIFSLGCNMLSLGSDRVISTGSAPRVDDAIRKLGFDVQTVTLDEFTQCGGGVHCLTMPLRRSSAASRLGSSPVNASGTSATFAGLRAETVDQSPGPSIPSSC